MSLYFKTEETKIWKTEEVTQSYSAGKCRSHCLIPAPVPKPSHGSPTSNRGDRLLWASTSWGILSGLSSEKWSCLVLLSSSKTLSLWQRTWWPTERRLGFPRHLPIWTDRCHSLYALASSICTPLLCSRTTKELMLHGTTIYFLNIYSLNTTPACPNRLISKTRTQSPFPTTILTGQSRVKVV